jgi:diguanylate cyclase (GGDEF)-like protein/PAS domain S-box-containing protein
MSMADPTSATGDASYRVLYEQAPCGFLSMTTSGRIVRVNETLLKWTGYSREQLMGATLGAFLDKGSQLFYETRYIPVLRLQKEVREVVLTLRKADGSPLPILVNSVLLAATAEGPELVSTALFDSTQRRDYELELLHARQSAESSEVRVRVLQDAATAFVQADSELTVAESLVESSKLAFAATETAVFMLDDHGQLQLVAGRSPIADLVPLDALRPGAEAIRTGRFIGISSLEEALAFSHEVADAMLATRLEAMTVIPLIADSGPIGTLACFYSRARRFDDDFARLQTALALQASQVLARVALQRQLRHLALHDQLTGLANRSLLQERMDEALAAAIRSGNPLTVLFLDLDGFKAVNDYLGHAVGDAVLREVAERLHSEVRLSDVVGRFGGDEFIVLCPETDEENAVLIANRVRVAIGRDFDGVLSEFPITSSVGAAVYRPGDQPMTSDILFMRADEAMYRSKNAGKDCVTLVTV